MEIGFHPNVGSVGRTPPHMPLARGSEAAQDEVALENTRALRRDLEATPDSRADLVDKAMIMVGDVNYPPRETIQKISHLLALGLYRDPSEA
jgi:hypothetical protein